MDRDPTERREGRISTDRETIRGWADEHQAVPVRHASTGGGSDAYHVVRESDVEESYERVEWDDFFGRTDEGDHVVIYHGAEASEPFEVTRRDELVSRSTVGEAELQDRLLEGETVTSEITETTVVESVVVEEATVESELVGSEVVDQRVVDVELIERGCTGCTLVESEAADDREWFDEDRYVSSVGTRSGRGTVEPGHTGSEPIESESSGLDTDTHLTGTEARSTSTEARSTDTEAEGREMEGTMGTETSPLEAIDQIPYSAKLDVEETWSVTREFVERFTVESRIEDTEVAETDTVEDRDIDVEGLHRSIARSDLLDLDLTSDEVLQECTIQTEFAEGDRIHTHFERERVVEDEVVDRKRLRADATGGDLLGMEVVRTQEVAAEGTGEPSTETAGATPDAEASTVSEPGAEAGVDVGRMTLTEDETGKTVVDTTGEEIGMVTDVDESGEIAYVDAHPGITQRIKAALNWGGADDDDYPVEVEQIQRVTDDRIELKGAEELGEDERTR